MRLSISLFILLCLSAQTLMAQQTSPDEEPKFGFLSVDKVLVHMPEMEGVQSELADFENKLLSQLKVKMDVFQTKLAAYQNLPENTPETVRLERKNELEASDADIQKFRSGAQQAVAQKELKLMQPLYNKIQMAIDLVAKENGLTQVFRAETLLFNANAVDIFDLLVDPLKLKLPTTAKGGN